MLLLILLFLGLTVLYSQNTNRENSIHLFQIDTLNKGELNPISMDITATNSYFTEWEKGFISGLIATLIGFILTILWDIYKNRRDKTEKDQIIKKLIQDTLNENLGYIVIISNMLTQEVAILNQRRSIVTNITTLKNDFWDLIKFNIPKDLLKNNNLLKKLQDISSLTKSINENINSREMYRLNNGAMSNFETRLRYYDELILSQNDNLNRQIIEFKTEYK